MTDNYTTIPQEMRDLPQWVVHNAQKIPFNPQTGTAAKAGQADTWTTFDIASKAAFTGNYTGLGFQFNANGIMGVDFDHCIVDGVLDSWVDSWIRRFNSYTEISPSGTGIHILCFGGLQGKPVKTKKAEMYDRSRYFTVTGNVYGNFKTLRVAEAEINALYAEIAKPEPQYQPRQTSPHSQGNFLEKGLNKRDIVLKDLWDGKRASSDESSNDMALLNKLAYWCNCDEDSMISAFLSSPHFEQKDEKHRKKAENRKDYLLRTVREAISKCTRTAAQDNENFIAERQKSALKDFKALANTTELQSPEQLKKYSLDDIGTARLFADLFREKIMYVSEYKGFFVYNGGRWKRDDNNSSLVKQCIKKFVKTITKLIPPKPEKETGVIVDVVSSKGEEAAEDEWLIYRKHYQKYTAFKYRETLRKDAQDQIQGSVLDFDKPPFLFNCRNGTLDLNTGTIRPHTPQDKLSKMARVDYNPNAACVRFVEFIDEITEGNKDRARMLQKALGYSLKGEANEECYFTAIGQKTRNGKGTLFDTVMNIFGDYGMQIDFNSISRGGAAKDGSQPTPDIARLVGVRLALSNEPQKGVYVNEALLKQLTGNDDITARPLYGDVMQFKPVFRLFVTANSKPSVSDDSLFASDRIKLLPFTRHFDAATRDTGLKALFRTEEAKSGILNWLIEGYRLYQAEGLKNTLEMEILTAAYRKENDYIGMYLDDRVSFETTEKTSLKALRADYEVWCRVAGTKPLGLRLFKEELEKRGIEVVMKRNIWVTQCHIMRNKNYEE